MQLKNFRIGARLTLGFTFLGILMVLQGVFALYSMASMHKISESIDKNTIPSLQHLAELNLNVMRMRVFTLRLLIADSDVDVQTAKQTIEDISQQINKTNYCIHWCSYFMTHICQKLVFRLISSFGKNLSAFQIIFQFYSR